MRTVIVENGASGNARFHERPGLLAAHEEFNAGCTWVGVSDVRRISRESSALTSFAVRLTDRGIDLVVAQYGLVDLSDAGRIGLDQAAVDLFLAMRCDDRSEMLRRMAEGQRLAAARRAKKGS